MLFAEENDLKDLVTHLINVPFSFQAVKYLQAEDQKQLEFSLNELKSKMPVELQSLKYGASQSSASAAQQESFPSMFESVDKKTYEYINEDAQNMHRFTSSLSVFPVNSAIPLANMQAIPPSHAIQKAVSSQFPQEKAGENEQVPRSAQPEAENAHASNKSQSASRHSFEGRSNPFISSKVNFTDKFANSKNLKVKYPHLKYSDSARNMTALAQGSKFNAFSNSVAYPTTVMPGTLLPPKDSTFARQGRMEVEDVMRYTLGATRRGFQSVQRDNPFVRPPSKKRE